MNRTNRLTVATALLLGMLLWPLGGASQSIKSARAQYNSGDFVTAAATGEKLGTFEGYMIAAASLTIHGHYFTDGKERQQILLNAMELARKAVELQPDNPEAHMYLVRAMGRYSQSIPSSKALSEGYGESVKETLETVLQLDPDSWEAQLGLGSWHAEIISKGGFLGKLAFGASEQKAREHFLKAAELAPVSIITYLEFARGLHALNAKKYREQVIRNLNRALELPASDAYDRVLQEDARKFLDTL